MKSEIRYDSECSLDYELDYEVNPDKVSQIISTSYPQMNLNESDLDSG